MLLLDGTTTGGGKEGWNAEGWNAEATPLALDKASARARAGGPFKIPPPLDGDRRRLLEVVDRIVSDLWHILCLFGSNYATTVMPMIKEF